MPDLSCYHSVMSGFMKRSAKLLKTKPLRREQISIDGKSYWINYMPEKLMREARFSGFAYNGQAYISNELSERDKRFTIQHELYHLRDKRRWLGYCGMELRANVVCGLKDPTGICAALYRGFRKGYVRTYLLALVGIGQD